MGVVGDTIEWDDGDIWTLSAPSVALATPKRATPEHVEENSLPLDGTWYTLRNEHVVIRNNIVQWPDERNPPTSPIQREDIESQKISMEESDGKTVSAKVVGDR